MYFAFGFLAAALIALLFFPALNLRAERLARRRAEAQFPLSVGELAAEKDHLRAEFAVLQRRLERKTEEALGVKQQSMEELGRRAVRIAALEGDLAERDGRIAKLETDLAETQRRFAATENDLTATQQVLKGVQEALSVLETAHRTLLDSSDVTRGERDAAQASLVDARTALAAAEEALERQRSEHADLEQRHAAKLDEFDVKRITVSDLETRLATQTARANELERALAEGRDELTAERRRLADLARSLVTEQERGLLLERRLETLEAERDAKAEAVKDEAAQATSAELHRRIDEVADAILRAAEPGESRRRRNKVAQKA